MKTCDLNTPTARLRQAMKDLQIARARIAEQWSDETHRQFEETFLAPLEPNMRRTVAAIGELAEVMAKAERECEGY
jgi:uncharacterized protein YukE